jgi:hypothetical protein
VSGALEYFRPSTTTGDYWEPMTSADYSNPAEAVVGILTPGAAMAQAAWAMMLTASFAFPTAIPLVREAVLAQTDTQAMGQACVALFRSGNFGAQAADEVRRQLDRIDDDVWQADDREAFEGKAQDYIKRIGLTQMVCLMTGTFTIILTFLIFILITVLFAFAVALFALAIAFWVAMALLPWSLGWGLQVEMWGNRLATMCHTFVKGFNTALTAMQHAWAGILGALTGLSVVTQIFLGGGLQTVIDLGQALVSGLDDAARGYIQRFENNLTAKYGARSPWAGGSVLHGSPWFSDTWGNPESGPFGDVDWGTQHATA